MVDCNVLREGPDTQVAGSGVDLVADLVVAHVGPDPRHDARDVVSEHEGRPVLKQQLELAVAYHLIQRVDAGSTHADQDVTGPDGGIWHLGGAEAALAISLDDECLHNRPPVVRRFLSSWWWSMLRCGYPVMCALTSGSCCPVNRKALAPSTRARALHPFRRTPRDPRTA